MPAMPPPRITTVLPAPTFDGQSPGRGEAIRPGGGGGAGGFIGAPGAADDDPQALSDVPIPIAAIVRSIAELPTARPMEVRNSRLARLVFFVGMILSAALADSSRGVEQQTCSVDRSADAVRSP